MHTTLVSINWSIDLDARTELGVDVVDPCDRHPEPLVQPAVRVTPDHRHSSAGQMGHVQHCRQVEHLVPNTTSVDVS